VHLSVKQTQKVDGKPAPFRLPMEMETLGDGAPQTFRFRVGGDAEDFYFGAAERPRTVLFDPRDIILKTVDFKKPASEWIWQLEHAPRPLNRSEAAIAIGGISSPEAVAALKRAGTTDAFWGTRIDAAGALGRIATEDARGALAEMLKDQSAEVRSAAAGALGGLPRNTDTVNRLFEIARTDPSFAVRRMALVAAARLKPDKGSELVKPFLAMDSPGQTMRAAAISALQQLGDESAAPAVLEYSRSEDDNVRSAALIAFSVLGKGKREVTDRLLEALESPEKRDVQMAIMAIRLRRDAAAIPALERLAATDALPRIARAARSAADSLRSGGPAAARPAAAPAGDGVMVLSNRLSELEKENAELKARVERLEKK
jgi:HEAT repeat protein